MLLSACAGSGGRSAAGAIPDAGSPGAQAFLNRCSICHAVPHPARHVYSGWLSLVPLMEQRMAERGVGPLSGEERSMILAYLKEYAR
ncbi:MAG: hypothetical protein OEU91_04985 [Gammaproteobacteria bacterium]|nr:hypothetical protein [Gammaproteobacteria bacterium]